MTPELRELLVVLFGVAAAGFVLLIAWRLLEPIVLSWRARIRHAQRTRFYLAEINHCTARARELNAAGDLHSAEYGDVGKRLEAALKFFAQGTQDPH